MKTEETPEWVGVLAFVGLLATIGAICLFGCWAACTAFIVGVFVFAGNRQ